VEVRIAEALSDLFPFLLGTSSSGEVGHA
jgi:hypothetical protein